MLYKKCNNILTVRNVTASFESTQQNFSALSYTWASMAMNFIHLYTVTVPVVECWSKVPMGQKLTHPSFRMQTCEKSTSIWK